MTTTKEPPFELVMSRVINAPRARVFEAWTTPEQMAQWFAPKPFKLVVDKMVFRPGGRFSMSMRGPNGEDSPFTGTYREIVPPAKLSWTGEFATGPTDQMSTVVAFEEQGQQTKVHVRQTFHVMTPEIEHATKGAKQGWTMTLDQLEGFCAAEAGLSDRIEKLIELIGTEAKNRLDSLKKVVDKAPVSRGWIGFNAGIDEAGIVHAISRTDPNKTLCGAKIIATNFTEGQRCPKCEALGAGKR